MTNNNNKKCEACISAQANLTSIKYIKIVNNILDENADLMVVGCQKHLKMLADKVPQIQYQTLEDIITKK